MKPHTTDYLSGSDAACLLDGGRPFARLPLGIGIQTQSRASLYLCQCWLAACLPRCFSGLCLSQLTVLIPLSTHTHAQSGLTYVDANDYRKRNGNLYSLFSIRWVNVNFFKKLFIRVSFYYLSFFPDIVVIINLQYFNCYF